MMENLEACKAHGGPITEEDLPKLDSFTYEQLVIEVGYLKKTIAPQLRFKRKVDGRFVNFTAKQLRQQLKDAIKPMNDSSCCLQALLQTALNEDTVNESPQMKECEAEPGTHGLWCGPLDEVAFGVLLDAHTLQKYKERRFGYVPDGLPERVEEWTLTKAISDSQFHYIEKGNTIYIVMNT